MRPRLAFTLFLIQKGPSQNATAPFHTFRSSPSASRSWKKNDLLLNQTVRFGIPLGPPSTQSEGGGHEVAEDSTNPMLNAISKRLKALFIFHSLFLHVPACAVSSKSQMFYWKRKNNCQPASSSKNPPRKIHARLYYPLHTNHYVSTFLQLSVQSGISRRRERAAEGTFP